MMTKIESIPPAFRHPLVWAFTWAAVGFLILSAYVLVIRQDLPFVGVFLFAFRFAFWGALFGGAFAVVAALAKRQLAAGNRVVVATLTGIAVGVALPLIMQALNLVGGEGMVAWKDVLDDSVWAVPFGALAAYLSLGVLQR